MKKHPNPDSVEEKATHRVTPITPEQVVAFSKQLSGFSERLVLLAQQMDNSGIKSAEIVAVDTMHRGLRYVSNGIGHLQKGVDATSRKKIFPPDTQLAAETPATYATKNSDPKPLADLAEKQERKLKQTKTKPSP
jgi:hypothetical protein